MVRAEYRCYLKGEIEGQGEKMTGPLVLDGNQNPTKPGEEMAKRGIADTLRLLRHPEILKPGFLTSELLGDAHLK